jgi:hypothetical protein
VKKGIVMEQHRKFTIVMTTDGLIEKAHPIKNTDIGIEVNYEPFVKKQWQTALTEKIFTMRVAALACIFLIALLPLYMAITSNETYAYVDIDINPSMELEIDSDLEVSGITPFNDDAKQILDQIGELEGKNIEDAIDIIIKTSEEKGLINPTKNVLIGVHYLKDDEKDPIIKTIEEHFNKKTTDWEVVAVVIPEEVRETAEEKQQSMNKTLANAVTGKSDNQVKSIITEEDKEVLQSFFNKEKSEVEITDDSQEKRIPTITNEKDKTLKEDIHPSELKAKNGEINSKKNGNGHENGKAKGHHKDKQQDKFNRDNRNHNGKANDGKGHNWDNENNGKNNNKNIEKSKQKDHHKRDHHQKDKREGNNGKGHNGKGDHGKHNGKGHDKKGNSNNGKNKDDDYSYIFPLYK